MKSKRIKKLALTIILVILNTIKVKSEDLQQVFKVKLIDSY